MMLRLSVPALFCYIRGILFRRCRQQQVFYYADDINFSWDFKTNRPWSKMQANRNKNEKMHQNDCTNNFRSRVLDIVPWFLKYICDISTNLRIFVQSLIWRVACCFSRIVLDRYAVQNRWTMESCSINHRRGNFKVKFEGWYKISKSRYICPNFCQ